MTRTRWRYLKFCCRHNFCPWGGYIVCYTVTWEHSSRQCTNFNNRKRPGTSGVAGQCLEEQVAHYLSWAYSECVTMYFKSQPNSLAEDIFGQRVATNRLRPVTCRQCWALSMNQLTRERNCFSHAKWEQWSFLHFMHSSSSLDIYCVA